MSNMGSKVKHVSITLIESDGSDPDKAACRAAARLSTSSEKFHVEKVIKQQRAASSDEFFVLTNSIHLMQKQTKRLTPNKTNDADQ